MAIGTKDDNKDGLTPSIPTAPAPSLSAPLSLPKNNTQTGNSSGSRLESANSKLEALKQKVQSSSLGEAFRESKNGASSSTSYAENQTPSGSGYTEQVNNSSDTSEAYQTSEPVIEESEPQLTLPEKKSQEEVMKEFNENTNKAFNAFKQNPDGENITKATEGPMAGRKNASFVPDYTNFYGGQTFEGQNAGRANHGFNGDFVYNGYYVDESDNKVFPQTDESGNITGFVDEKGNEVTSGVRIIDGATEWADNDWAAFSYLSGVLDEGGWIDPDTAYGCQQLAANLSYDYTKLGDYWRGQLEADKKDFSEFDFDAYGEEVGTSVRDAWLSRQKDMSDYISWLDGMSDASKNMYDIFVQNNSIYSQYDDDKRLTQDQINQQVLEAAQAANQFGTFTDEEIRSMMDFTDADWENYLEDHKNEPHNAQNAYTQKAWENKGADIEAVHAAITAAKENANYINDKVAIGRNYVSMGNSVEEWQNALATLDPNSPNFEHERRFIQEKIDGIRAYDISEQYKSVSSEDIRKEIFEMKYGKGASEAEGGPSYEESYALAMEKRDAYNDAVRKLDELSKTASHTSREYLDAYQAVKDAKAAYEEAKANTQIDWSEITDFSSFMDLFAGAPEMNALSEEDRKKIETLQQILQTRELMELNSVSIDDLKDEVSQKEAAYQEALEKAERYESDAYGHGFLAPMNEDNYDEAAARTEREAAKEIMLYAEQELEEAKKKLALKEAMEQVNVRTSLDYNREVASGKEKFGDLAAYKETIDDVMSDLNGLAYYNLGNPDLDEAKKAALDERLAKDKNYQEAIERLAAIGVSEEDARELAWLYRTPDFNTDLLFPATERKESWFDKLMKPLSMGTKQVGTFNENEINDFYYYLAKEGAAAAAQYALNTNNAYQQEYNDLAHERYDQIMDWRAKNYGKFQTTMEALASPVGTTIMNMAALPEAVRNIVRAGHAGMYVAPTNPTASQMAEWQQQAYTKELAKAYPGFKALDFFYGAYTSTVNSAMMMAMGSSLAAALGITDAIAIGGKGAAELFTSAFTDLAFFGSASASRYRELIQQGIDPEKAATAATYAGAFEAAFEHISIENLYHAKDVETWKSYVDWAWNTLASAGIEGSEELFTNWANRLADNIFLGEDSDFNQSLKRYKAEGFSDDQAMRYAMHDILKEDATAFASGALSSVPNVGVHGAVAFHMDQKEYARYRAEAGHEYNVDAGNGKKGSQVLGEYLWHYDFIREGDEGSFTEGQKKIADTIKELAIKAAKGTATDEEVGRLTYLADNFDRQAIDDFALENKEWFGQVAPGRLVSLATSSLSSLLGPEGAQQYMEAVRANPNARIENDFALGLKKAVGASVDDNKISRVQSILETILRGSEYTNEEAIKAALDTGDLNSPEIQMYVWEYLKGKLPADTPVTEAVQVAGEKAGLTPSKEWTDQNVQHTIPAAEQAAQTKVQTEDGSTPTVIPSAEQAEGKTEPAYMPETDRYKPIIQTIGMDPNVNQDNVKEALQSVLGAAWKKSRDAMYQFRIRQSALSETNRKLAKMQAEDSKAAATEAMAKTPENKASDISKYRDKNDALTLSGKTMTRAEFIEEYKKGINGFTGREIVGKTSAKAANEAFDNMLLNSTKQDGLNVEGIAASMVKYDLSTREPLAKTGEKKADQQQEPKAPKEEAPKAAEEKPQVEERKESGEAKAEEKAPTPVTYTYEGYTYEATKNGYVVRDPSGEEIGTATNRVDAAELIRVAIASKAPVPAAEAPATVIPTAETPAETAPVEEKKPVSIPSKEQADAKSEAAKKAIEQAKEDARREAKEKAIEKAMATYESKKKKAEDALQKEEEAKVAADEAKAKADAIEESNTKEKADANEAADKAREEAKKAHKKAVTAQREARKAMEAADALLAENETEAPTAETPVAETPEVQAEQAPETTPKEVAETAPEEVAEEKVETPTAEVQEAVESAVSDENLTATDAGIDTSWRTWKDEATDTASGDTVTREEFVKREMEGVDGFGGVMKTTPKTAAQANDLFDDFLDQAEDNEQTNFYDYNYKGPSFSTAVSEGGQTSAPINIPTVTAEQVPGMVNLSEVGYNSENRTIGASSRSWEDAIPAANGSTITRAQFVAAAMSGKNAYSGGDMRVMSGVAANDLFDDIVDSKVMNGGFTDTVNGSTKVSDPIITSGMTEVPGIVGSLAVNLAILEAETREAAKARETIAGYQSRVDSARKQLEAAIKTEISESATEVTDARNNLRTRLAEIENRLGVIKNREITNPESALEYEGEVQGLRNERQRLLNQVYNINAAEARYNRALDRLNAARNTMYVNDYYTVIGGSNYEGSAGTSGLTGRNNNVGRTGSSGSAAVYAGGSTGNVQGSATGSTRQAFSTPTEILSKNGITLKGEVAFDTAGKTPQQIANDKSIPATLRNSILHAMRNGLGRVIITRGELSNGKTMINEKGKEVPQPIGGFYDTITENGKERAVVVLNQDRLTENNIRHEFVHHMMRKMSNAQKRDFLRSSIQIMFQGREDLFKGVFETYKVDYATAYGRTVDDEGRVDQDLAYKIYEEMVADFYAGIPRFVNNAEFAKAMAPLFTEARIRLTDHFERMGLEDYARAKWTDQVYESESLLDINRFGEAETPYGQEYTEAKPQPRLGTYQADLKNRTITDADTGRTIQYSVSPTEVGTYDLAEFSEAQDINGGPLFQVYAFDHDEPEYKRMLTEWGGMSEQEINNLFQTVDSAMDMIKENLEALDYAWEADIDDRGFLPVKPNSDKLYKVSQDFSTLCRKRLLQMAVQNELQAALNRALTRDEGIAIRNALVAIQEEGKQIEVACALCYVESARMKTPEQIQKFLDNREKVIRDYFASKDKAESKKRIAEADAAERDKIARAHGDENGMVVGKDGNLYDVRDPKATPMNKLPKQWSDQIKVARREAKSQHKFTPEQQRIVDIANSMSISDFTSPKGLENLAKNHRELFDAYTSFVRAAAHSKGIEDDTWWRAGDSATISDRLIEQMNAENGLRTQSWSDFQVKHLMDYVAATIELSTRGAQQHAYTKVPDYVDLMGNTGVMINMSLIPTREFNGTLRYDDVEGFVYDKTLALRNKYHETAGTICIGVDNEQIRQLLASDVIDYIIPYHQSGMALHTRIAMNIPTWEDYQNYQNEKQLNGAEAQANAEKYGVKLLDVNDKNWHNAPKFSDWFDLETAKRDVEEVGKSGEYGVMTGGYVAMQRAAEKYKQLCAERGLASKFSYGKGNFVDQDNYWKLLIDRKMVDNVTGDIIEQKALRPIFDKDVISRILNDELDRYGTVKADQEEAIRRVTQEFLAGNLREGMKLDEIRQVMQKPVDNISVVNITQNSEGMATETPSYSLSPADMTAVDKEYVQAIEADHMSKAQTIIDKEARSRGYKKKLYHGTQKYGFNEFWEVSRNEFGVHLGTEQAARHFYDTALLKKNGVWGDNLGVYNVYAKMENTLRLPDEFGRYDALRTIVENIPYWAEEGYWGSGSKLTRKDFSKLEGTLVDNDDYQAYLEAVEEAEDLEVAYNQSWGQERADLEDEFFEAEREANQRAREYLLNLGYDSIVYNNKIEDAGNDSYIILKPENIKSAEVVTEDDRGNVILPSQRFDDSNRDIRYSIVHDVVDVNGKVYEDVLRLAYPEDTSIFDTRNSMKYYARQYLAGRTIGVRDHDGKQEKITFANRGDVVEKHLNQHAALDELSYGKSSGPLSRLVYLNAEEALEAVDDPKHIPQNPDWWENHEWFDENGWDWYDGWVMDKDNKLYPLTLHVANTRDGRSILYNAYVGIRNPVDVDIEATAENNPNEDFTTTPVLPEKERVGRGSAARPANTQNGEVMFSLSNADVEYGLNFRDPTGELLDKVFDGSKKYETRNYTDKRGNGKIPKAYLNTPMGIVQTGAGQAKYVGNWELGDGELRDYDWLSKHAAELGNDGTEFEAKPGDRKWVYPIISAERVDPREVTSRGIRARRIQFSLSDMDSILDDYLFTPGADLDVEELRPYLDPYDFAQLQHELDALGLGLTLDNTEDTAEEVATEEPEIELPPEERRPSRRVENGEYNSTAYLKPETLDIWLSDSGFAASSKNYAQAYIGWMNPDDFLYLSTGSYEAEDQKRAEGYYGDIDNISQRAQLGREADTIHLSIDHETGKVTGHEGRHRMDMLQHLGVENIPVLFFDLTNKTSKELMHNPTLTCEWNDRRKITLNTDLIPLNQNNRALIENEFVNGEGEDQSKPTVRFSLATDAQHEVTVEEVQEARDKWMGLKIAMDEQQEEFDTQTNRAYRGDITLDEYQTWLKESGYEDTHKAAREAWDEYNKLNKLYDAQYDMREEQKERQAITDSGLTEAEYFAKKAVNEFGYTPYFYDAGYIMPNGKMLNFSGEKGKHFGSRGEDHRGIETIFATTRRGKALTRFVNYGNIRIMPEGPGLEISNSVEPTPEQYSKIRDFIRQYQQQGYFGIDLADERGYAVGTLEYENNINPVRIVNDIKTFYRTGEIPQQSTTSQFHGQFSLSINQDAAFDQFGDEIQLDDYNPSVTQSASSDNLYYSEDGNTAYYQTDSGETVVLDNIGPDSPEAQYINSLEANNNANSTNTTTTEPHPIPASNRNVDDGYNLREQDAGLRRGSEEVPASVQEGTLRRAGSTSERNGQSGSQSEETQGVSYGLLMPDDTITPFINQYGDTVTTAETYPYGSMERIMIEAWDNKDFTKMQEQLDELFGDREDRDQILDIAEQINQQHPELTDQQRKATQKLIDELRVLWGTMPSRKNPTRDVHLPTSVDGTTKIMKGAQTIAQEAATEWLSEETMYEALNNEILSYVPTPNATAIKQAEEYIKAHNGNYDVLAAQVHAWLESGQRVKPWQVAVGELLLKEVETEGKADVAMGLVIDLTLIAHETGQALQAFNILRKATPRGQLYYLQGVVNQLNKQYADKINSGKMSKVELPKWAASRMLACQTREELNNTVEEIKDAIAKSIPVSWADRWNAWRYLAMLGNPRTHVRNMLGNAMFSPAVFMKDIIARWIEEHYDSVGKLEGRVKAKNVNLHEDTEWMKMAIEDFNVMQKILVGEAVGNKYADANDILSRRDLWGKEKWLGGKFLAWADELNSMGLTKEDERFLKKYYTRAFAEFLQARGVTEAAIADGSFGADKNKEDRKLIAEARAWATLEAQRNTYRDANAFAQWVNSMKRKNKTAYVLLEGLMPFTKTPMNILSRGIEYSPIGLIQSIVQLNRDLQSSDKMTTSQAIDRLAAGMTGTMIMGLGLLLSSLGVLRGSGGDDKKKKELEELQGHQAWSVELFGRSYTIDWMAPAALPLFIGSAIHDMLVRDSDEELSFENILLALAGVANPLSQLSMLDGINSMLTNLSNTEGTEQYAVLAWSMLTSYAAQGVPTLLGQVARTFDEDRRSTYIQPGSANPMLQRFIQTSLQGKIPGWENQKMAYVDNWGRKDTNSSFIGRALENFLSPGYYNRIVQTDVDAELERLYAATKDADIIPTKMQKYFQVDGERKNLTAEEYQNLLTERGQEAYNVLNELIKTPYYDSLSDGEKAKLVADTLEYSENYGKFMTDANYDMASHWMQAAMDIGAVDYMMIKNDLEKNRTHEQLFTYLLSNPNLSLDQISYLVADEYAAPDSIDSVANNGWHYDLNDDDEAAMQDIFKSLLNTRLAELESDPKYINGDANKRGMMMDNLYSEVREDTKTMYAEQLDREGRQAVLSKSSSIGKDSFGMVLDLTKNDIAGDYSDDISAQAAWLGQQYRPDTKIDNPDRNGWAIELSKDDKDELYDAFQKEWDKAYRNLVTNDPEFLNATSREYQNSMIESLCKEIEKKVEDEYASELYKSGKANEVIGTPKGTAKADWISNYAIAKDAFPGDIQAQAEWYAQRFTGASTLDNPDRPGYNIKTSNAQKEELAKREQAEFISKYVALHNDPDFKAMSSDDQDLAVYQLAQNVMDIGEAEYSRYLLDRGAKIEQAVDTQCSNVEYFNMVFSENLTEAERMDMIEQRYDRYVGTSILNHDLDYIMRNHRVDAYMQYVADNLYKIAGLTGQEGADAYIAKIHKPAMDASKKSIQSEYGISGKTTAEAEDERRAAEGYNYGLHVSTNMNTVRPQASTNTPPAATRSSSGTTKASATTDATKPKSNSGYVIPPANQMSDSLKYRPNW